MTTAEGFWSYVHDDDNAEGGRILRLAHDLREAFQLATGEPIELFLDKDGLDWGDEWKNKVDASLASVAFFIPVITPRYFASAECRHELQFFARRATDLGIGQLVLPLLYVDVPSLHEESPEDHLALLVKKLQWEDWTDLRFSDPASEEYRRAVSKLADRLIRANAEADRADVAERVSQLQESRSQGDDEPGWLDTVADADATMPEWTETLQAIGREIEAIGRIMASGTQEMERGEARGKGLAARLTIARRIAQNLREPAENIYSFGNQFTEQLHAVDAGLRLVIDRAPAEIEQDPSSKEQFCSFFETVKDLSEKAHEGLGSIAGMIESMAPLEAASRDLRKPLRRLREGLTVMLEGREVTDEWVRLIDATGVDCDGAETG